MHYTDCSAFSILSPSKNPYNNNLPSFVAADSTFLISLTETDKVAKFIMLLLGVAGKVKPITTLSKNNPKLVPKAYQFLCSAAKKTY